MTSEFLPQRIDRDAPVFPISVAAQLADMHPQTLRGYDRLGLVVPTRTRGRGRRYSLRDIAKLRNIQRMSQDEGINLVGIQRILALEDEVEAQRVQLEHLSEVVHRLQSPEYGARLFTAEASGAVHLGRARGRRPLALASEVDRPPVFDVIYSTAVITELGDDRVLG